MTATLSFNPAGSGGLDCPTAEERSVTFCFFRSKLLVHTNLSSPERQMKHFGPARAIYLDLHPVAVVELQQAMQKLPDADRPSAKLWQRHSCDASWGLSCFIHTLHRYN